MTKQFRLGAAITPKRREQLNVPALVPPVLPRPHPDAYRMAIANKHKGWAKRWLRERRHWLYANGLIEISPSAIFGGK